MIKYYKYWFCFSDNFVLSRISIVLNFGQNRSNFSDRGRGLFAITPLMWTNAGNAATFLGLSELIRQHFCFDLVTSEYDAVEVPIKAGVMLALLLEVNMSLKIENFRLYFSKKKVLKLTDEVKLYCFRNHKCNFLHSGNVVQF